MTIKKILVGIDFSEHSEVALAQALDLASQFGAEVVLAHAGVVPDPAIELSPSLEVDASDWHQMLSGDVQRKREILTSLGERHERRGVTISHRFIDDFPDSGLVKTAEEQGADLVVVGSRGNTGLKRFVLGSVAERVVRHFGGHVMVARSTQPTQRGFGRLLVPTDFSERAGNALDLAADLIAPDGTIEVLHCWQLPPMATTYGIARAEGTAPGTLPYDIRTRIDTVAESVLAPYRERGLNIEFRRVEGPPTSAITEVASEGSYDAIVMGSHGRRGVRRFLLGSVAETTVRYAPTSVLVAHARAGEAPPRSEP